MQVRAVGKGQRGDFSVGYLFLEPLYFRLTGGVEQADCAQERNDEDCGDSLAPCGDTRAAGGRVSCFCGNAERLATCWKAALAAARRRRAACRKALPVVLRHPDCIRSRRSHICTSSCSCAESLFSKYSFSLVMTLFPCYSPDACLFRTSCYNKNNRTLPIA